MNEASIKQSVSELKDMLSNRYGNGIGIYIFGSAARGDYRKDSDIDVLVLFPGPVDTDLKEEIIDLAFDIELENNVIFGIVVRSSDYWASEKAAVTPFHQNVVREAMRI